MKKIMLNGLLTLVSLLYPIGILWQWNSTNLAILPYVLAILWGCKGWLSTGIHRYFAFIMTALLWMSGASRMAWNVMYWYPVFINGIMLMLFASSLWSSQTVIERLARLQEPNLPPEAVSYTRKVTQLWCVVFILNIVISSLLVWFEKIDLWALYTGVIAYVIMGIVMLGEWLIRPKNK